MSIYILVSPVMFIKAGMYMERGADEGLYFLVGGVFMMLLGIIEHHIRETA